MATSSQPSPLVIEARGLVKRYGHVTALDGADFELRRGEILGVIGDNGAGKSTLIKALSGALIPDEGEMFLDGEPVKFGTPDRRAPAGDRNGISGPGGGSRDDDRGKSVPRARDPQARGVGIVLRLLDKKKMNAEAIAHMRTCRSALVRRSRGGDALRRSAAGRRGGAQRGVRAPCRDHGRAHCGARREGIQHGARPDSPGARPWAAGHSRQPQHAARVRGRRSHPHPTLRATCRVSERDEIKMADAVAIMTGATSGTAS